MGNQVDTVCRRSHFTRKKNTLARAKKLLPRLFKVKACVLPIPEQFGSEYPTADTLVKEM